MEIDRFNKEVILILKSYVKSEFNISIVINPKNILGDMKNIIDSNVPIKLKEFLDHAINSYKQELSSFSTQMRRNKENVKNFPDEQLFNSTFGLGQEKILIEGDKNIGYVCMYVQDLLQQYEKINHQQHFGKVDLDKIGILGIYLILLNKLK